MKENDRVRAFRAHREDETFMLTVI